MVKVADEYKIRYQESIDDPENFWKKELSRLDWLRLPTKITNTNFKDDISIKWFEDGELNPCFNFIDRHVINGKGDDIAIIWEGNNPENSLSISYSKLLEEVSNFANILEHHQVKKGDTVIIYMPMIPEAAYAMLACTRIGAVHSVVFGGFSAKALADRIKDCSPKIIITADETRRGDKFLPLKNDVSEALGILNRKITTLVVKNTGHEILWEEQSDFWYHSEKTKFTNIHTNVAVMNAEDPLFILYTSGSTGKPKGILHTIAGYMLYIAITFKYSFNYQKNDIFWCSADIGWITGHSYVIYAPLLHGATTLMFEGIPTYSDASRFWQVIDKHRVNIFYTAPTAIRSLMKESDKFVSSTSRKSLRIIGSVGEPINPEAWHWLNEIVGEKRCAIVDTWWQTETGGHMIAPLPGLIEAVPAYATLPFFGVDIVLVDNEGNEIKGAGEGNLCIRNSWPGQARSIYNDHPRFIETYFSRFPALYFTGDGAKREENGYIRITGRVDDVLNVSGHRLATAEIEAALNEHPKIAESAVVGYPHEIKGEGIYAYVIVKSEVVTDEILRNELKKLVRTSIGAIATPDIIHFVEDLPKTRSGKIMRRVIRKIAAGEVDNLGDLSTLSNPQIVDKILGLV